MAQVNITNDEPTIIDPTSTQRVSLQPAPSPLTSTAEDHSTSDARTRFFIGPIPISVAAPQIKRIRRVIETLTRTRTTETLSDLNSEDPSIANASTMATSSTDTGAPSDDILWRFIRRSHEARERRDGESQWGEDIAPGLREELIGRLRSSAWLSNPRQKQSTKWIGDTFQVGTDLLGHSTALEGVRSPRATPPSSRSSSAAAAIPKSLMTASLPCQTPNGNGDISASPSTYVTAPESPVNGHSITTSPKSLTPNGSIRRAKSSPNLPASPSPSSPGPFATRAALDAEPYLSEAATLPVPISQSNSNGLRSALRQSGTSISNSEARKRKRSVLFAASPPIPEEADDNLRDDEGLPAPPARVLARSASAGQLASTSAGSAAASQAVFPSPPPMPLTGKPRPNIPLDLFSDLCHRSHACPSMLHGARGSPSRF